MAITMPRAGTAEARAAVSVIAISGAMLPLGLLVAAATLPTIARYFWLDPTSAAWVLHAYLIPLAGLALVARRGAEQYGPRRVMRWGIEAYTVGAAMAGVAPGVPVLLAGRVAQGVGAALLLGGGLALLHDRLPAEGHGQVLTLTAGLAGLAALAGVTLGPLLTGLVAWQAAYLLMVPAGLYAMWRLERLPADAVTDRPGGAPDWAGAALLSLTLTALALSATHFHGEAAVVEQGWPYHTTLHVITALLLAAFLVVEARARTPLLSVALLRSRRWRLPVVALTAAVVGLLGLLVLTPPLVEWDRQAPAAGSGLLLGLMLLAGIGAGLASLRLAARFRWAGLAPLAFGLLAGGALVLGGWGRHLGDLELALVLSATVAAATIGGLASLRPLPAAPARPPGAVAGLLVVATLVGCALAISLTVGLIGLILEYQHSQALPRPTEPVAVTFPIARSFLSLAPVAGLGAIAAWRGRARREAGQDGPA